MYTSTDGFASGSKDGTIGLWDIEFKPITRIDLNQHALGYKGTYFCSLMQFFIFFFIFLFWGFFYGLFFLIKLIICSKAGLTI